MRLQRASGGAEHRSAALMTSNSVLLDPTPELKTHWEELLMMEGNAALFQTAATHTHTHPGLLFLGLFDVCRLQPELTGHG